MKLNHQITEFVRAVGTGGIEIYNEISLQIELGLYLRNHLGKCNVQFERNVSHFKLAKSAFEKKEIDIAIMSAESGEFLSAIELKFPRNGQVPESMFGFCKDIAFLERLVLSKFQSAYFLVVVDNPLFYSGTGEGIYGFFRSGKPITGKITKPTGAKDKKVKINGSYIAEWHPVSGNTKYCLIQVSS